MGNEEKTLEFGLAHDEVKERNSLLEKETEKFGLEADLHIGNIEKEIMDHIDEMKSELDTLVSDMQKSLREQTVEFQQDVEWDLKGIGNDDPSHEFETGARDLKKELSNDISEMQDQIRTTIENLGDKVDTKIDILKDLSEMELKMTLDGIIEQAKNDELPVNEE
jgi:hypothetical protein